MLPALLLSVFLFAGPLLAQPNKEIAPQERCPVCGMFVAKYTDWITQVRLNNGAVKFFDGVKDYYTLAWLDGRSAWYVVGSNVYGPMGHEFIPFNSAAAAENFRKDHNGTKVVRFDEITEPLVQSMRHGQKMR